MIKHVHIGAEDFLIFTLYLLIAMFFLQVLAARFSDTAFGKALSFIIGS